MVFTEYLEGRPQAHILHRRFAEAVSQRVRYIDHKTRWQDQGRGVWFNFSAWWDNAKYLSGSSEDVDIFLVDNLHLTPVLMNILLGIKGKKRKKLVVHLGSHTLYFMHARRFKALNHLLHKWMLSKYDALLCEGDMARDFASEFYPDRSRIFTTFLGPPAERQSELSQLTPALDGNYLMILANGPGEFRKFYKGLDLMIDAFKESRNTRSDLKLLVVGHWDEDISKELQGDFSEGIDFVGAVTDITPYFSKVSLVLHTSRGDAFPTSTIEAMSAGLPVIVSDITGTREIVSKVSQEFVVEAEIDKICERILWYFSLSPEERQAFGSAFRRASEGYTEELAIEHYRDTFKRVIDKVQSK